MGKPRKLIIIGSYAPSLINFRGKLIEAAVARGLHVIAMSPDLDDATTQALIKLGAEPKAYKLQRTGMNAISDASSLYVLYRFFKEEQPDIVLSYTMKPVVYASVAAYLTGVPCIFSIITGLGFSFSSTGWKQKVTSVIVSMFLKFSLSKNDGVFFQNPDDRDFFVKEKKFVKYDRATVVNGSGVDLDYFSIFKQPSSPRFLMVSRLLKEKGVYDYIEAARLIKRRYPNVQFDLAGWIDTAPTAISSSELEEWIQEGVINYLGKLSDVRTAMRMCSVFVLPSYREGTPRTVLEAMAMGRAILTTDVPGCRETVIDGENGYLIGREDPLELAQKMSILIDDEAISSKMGKRSREMAVEKYDVNRVNDVILKGLGV